MGMILPRNLLLVVLIGLLLVMAFVSVATAFGPMEYVSASWLELGAIGALACAWGLLHRAARDHEMRISRVAGDG